ncbi:MAG TPA: plasmid mobilization relaxosome protein MobC [Thermoanaerobaculia bacterium]|nr:plasmid mobilization relaxosome protein MobC [Thermoanaerobaculia bacterium]
MPRSLLPRRPGRPPLPPERRHRHPLLLRLTLAERDTLRRRAALARLPVAAYAREQALRRSPSLRAVPVVNIRSVGQLGRLANNLNQLTKLAHQGRTSPALLPCLERLLAEVAALRRLLIGLPPRDRDKRTGR